MHRELGRWRHRAGVVEASSRCGNPAGAAEAVASRAPASSAVARAVAMCLRCEARSK
jgi:hypothetical protein